MNENMNSIIDKFKSYKVGNILITTEPEHDYFCLFTKWDFLLSIMGNKIHKKDLPYLQTKICDLEYEIIITKDRAFVAATTDTLF